MQERACLLRLAQSDERLDLIGQEPQHPRLADAGLEYAFGERPKQPIGRLHVPQRQFEESECREVELTGLLQTGLPGELQPLRGGGPCGLLPSSVRLDERLGGKSGAR